MTTTTQIAHKPDPHQHPAPTHRLISEAYIDAPAAVVWQVLMDTEAYPQWNPFTSQLQGRLDMGESFVLTVHLGGQALKVRERCISLIPLQEMVWRPVEWYARLGISSGQRTQRLVVQPDGRVLFWQEELFWGPCSWLAVRFFAAKIQRGLDAMGAALGLRARAASQLFA